MYNMYVSCRHCVDILVHICLGETCLHMAAAGHHLEVIQYLTTHAGADINAKVTMTCWTWYVGLSLDLVSMYP